MEDNKEQSPEPTSSGLSEEQVKSIVEKALEPFTKKVDERFENLMQDFYNKVSETVKDEINKTEPETIDPNDDRYNF